MTLKYLKSPLVLPRPSAAELRMEIYSSSSCGRIGLEWNPVCGNCVREQIHVGINGLIQLWIVQSETPLPSLSLSLPPALLLLCLHNVLHKWLLHSLPPLKWFHLPFLLTVCCSGSVWMDLFSLASDPDWSVNCKMHLHLNYYEWNRWWWWEERGQGFKSLDSWLFWEEQNFLGN